MPRLSILDLALIGPGENAGDALRGCVELAQTAERCGYARVWYAEHHNMSSIASSAPAVLIAHFAANTRSIRLGSGGVMLPNHAPLVIAEQFGTLASLHPDRIDLGIGRAPGTDQVTVAALRRAATAADRFADDVVELQGFLGERSRVSGVAATPGQGTSVPIYVLGSSLYGAQLAALLGLPFGFASHFAPNDLESAVSLYRNRFRPSDQLEEPYVIAGFSVAVAEDEQTAVAHFLQAKRRRASLFLGGGAEWTDEQADEALASPQGRFLNQMTRYSAAGNPNAVAAAVAQFAAHADCDEVITVHLSPSIKDRCRSVELLTSG